MTVARNVTVIPARARVRNNQNEEKQKKLRVAAYCRVSTDSDEQASSYEVQINITHLISKAIQNGNLQAFMPMMESQEQIQKSESSLTE